MMKSFTKRIFKNLLGVVGVLSAIGFSNNVQAQYCTPSYIYGCSNGARIDEVVTTGAVVNINNVGTWCGPTTAAGFTDYATTGTVSGLTALKGSTINFSVKIISWSAGVKIWIDYNGNEVFDATELVAESPGLVTAGTFFTGSFTIPTTATASATRMRIRNVESYSVFTPCSEQYYGETEDYNVTIIDPTSCADIVDPLDAGTVSGVDSICPDVSFVLNASISTIYTGTTIQWQESSSATGPFTDITGATGFAYSSSGIPSNTYYRYYISCPDGTSDTAASKLVALKSAIDCYCEPTLTGSCDYSWSSILKDVFTAGALVDISNLNTGCASLTSPGYSDYSSDPTLQLSAIKGVPFSMTVNTEGSPGGVKIWIDFDQNGTFDDTELVAESTDYVVFGTPFTSLVSIPITATTGMTKMRVRSQYYTLFYDPCEPTYYGETEDYLVNIIEPTPCLTATTPIDAGVVNTVDSICPSTAFTLMVSGATLAYSGLTIQWQSSESATGPFVDIPGATSSFFSHPGIIVPTYFRMFISCAGGASDTSNVHFVNVSSYLSCNCIPTYTSGCGSGATINDVYTTEAVVDINNMGTGCGALTAPAYSDYGTTPGMAVTAIKTVPFSLNVGVISYGGGVKVWIDYNHDAVFDETEVATASYALVPAGTTYTGTVTIPATALEGPAKMRVRVVESWTDFEACTEYYYGETEDYLINIVNPISCTEADIPTSLTATAIPTEVCSGDKAVLKLGTTLPIAFGYNYKWKYSSSATGPWTYLTPDLMDNSTQVSNTITSNTYFVMELYCEETLIRTTSAVLVTPVVPSSPVASDSQICGPGLGVLTGSTSSGSLYWYDAPTAASPVGVGTTFTTPYLTATTSYWVSSGAYPAELDTVGIAATTSTTTDPGPFNKSFSNNNIQFVYTKTQLLDAGVTAGKISSLMFYAESVPTTALINYNISWKQNKLPLPISYSNMDWIPALSGATVLPTASGWYEIILSDPIYWNGEDNLLLQICYNVPSTEIGSEGAYRYTNKTGQMTTRRNNTVGADPCNMLATSFASNKLPNVIFVRGACESARTEVVLNVRDTPTVSIIEPNGTYCMDLGAFQINTSVASSSPVTYLWNTGATTPINNATASGTYSVTATNIYGCSHSDTATYTLNPSPEVSLGPDKIVCSDGDLVLDGTAEGTATYYWNTGAITPTITVTDGGSYVVFVTNELGCIGSDTINVTVSGMMPYMAGINVNAMSPTTFQFNAILPNYITSYYWEFGDGTPGSYSATPIHTYVTPGTYEVTCTVTSTCGTKVYKTFATTVNSINNNGANSGISIYPNPAQETVTIATTNVNINSIKVLNTLGQELGVFDKINTANTTLDISNLPAGNYMLMIETKEGISQHKLSIVR